MVTGLPEMSAFCHASAGRYSADRTLNILSILHAAKLSSFQNYSLILRVSRILGRIISIVERAESLDDTTQCKLPVLIDAIP